MKTSAMALAASILCVAGMPVLANDGVPSALAVYQGSLNLAPYPEQVDCPGPALQTRLIYLAMPGVCDDLGPRPCAGRLVAEIERCAQDNVALGAGGLAGGYSRSAVRFCIDTEPVSGGAVSCTEHNQVGHGTWIGAGYADAAVTVVDATAVLTLRRTRAFLLDGQWRRLSRDRQVQHFSQQRSLPGPGSCAVAPQAGCGVIGVGVY